MNGVTGDISAEDAIGIAEMLVILRHAVPPHLWVDDLVEDGQRRALENLF